MSRRQAPTAEIPEEPGAGAASLALLAVCARLGHDMARQEMRFQILPSTQPVAFNAAVGQLVAFLKPVRIRGTLVNGIVEIVARTLIEGCPERALLEHQNQTDLSTHDRLGFLRERYDGDISLLRVACLGGGLVRHVRVRDVDQWLVEYHHEGLGGWAADFADSAYPSLQGAAADDVAGCAAFVKLFGDGGRAFFFSDPWASTRNPSPT